MSYKILIATRSFGSTSNRPWEVLYEAGCDLVKADMSMPMDEKRLIDLLAGIEGAIIGVVPMTERVISQAPSLKVVSMHGVGTDHVDLDAARRYGIVVANCLETNNQAVADLTIGLMLSLARQIPKVDQELRKGGWGRYKGAEIWRKTLGLVGLGYIGQAVARRAAGFDMTILVYDPFINLDGIAIPGLRSASLGDLLEQADFVSLHAPLNENTHHMIAADQLSLMKSSAYLINTARGGLVDEDALHQALANGAIAGAALDVYDNEPPVGSPLLALDNVILTPHIGAHTVEAIERVGVMAAENVLRVLTGQEPHHRVA